MGHRILQINELLRKEISKIFLKEITFPENCLATVSSVQTTKNLEQSTVMVSVLPSPEQEPVLKFLNKRAGFIQHLLGQKLIIRKIPKIIFKFDASGEKTSHIDELIDKIHHQG